MSLISNLSKRAKAVSTSSFKGELPAPAGDIYTHWEIDSLEDGIYFVTHINAQKLLVNSHAMPEYLPNEWDWSGFLQKTTVSYNTTQTTFIHYTAFASHFQTEATYYSDLSENNQTEFDLWDWQDVMVGYAFNAFDCVAGGVLDNRLKDKISYALSPHYAINNPSKSRMAWDYSANKPVWYNGTVWIYADGTQIIE